MIYSAIIYISRAVCLMLVFATGMSGIAVASHDGSHGSHCIDAGQGEPLSPHSHSADQFETAADPEAKERSCEQHSCVAVHVGIAMDACVQRLVSALPSLRGHLLHASLSAESLHRPPIA